MALEKKIDKVVTLLGIFTIGFCIFYSSAFAEPVYTEGTFYQIEILEDGQLQVREATRVYKDGVEIAKTYHRHVKAPGDNISSEVGRVKAVADAVWTQKVIDDYATAKAARDALHQ